MRAVEKYIGADAQFQKGALVLAGHTVPDLAPAFHRHQLRRSPDTFPSVSLADFEAAAKAGNTAQLQKWVKGKIVLVGTDFVDDRFDTPFYTLFSGSKWTMPGVEIHANTVRTLLEGRYLLPVPQWLRALALLMATGLTVLVITSLPASRAVSLMLLEVLAILIATHLAFEGGFILSTSELLLATSICLIASVVYRFATEETRGNLFQRAVSLFVGKQLATSLEETEAIALSGKRLEVTILFTDIRGFTAFTERVSEEQGPEVVVQLLNEYLATMVGIIMMYGGHVNKFIGDGILAVFSDEDEGATPGDHAVRAVRCATRMVTAPSQFETGAGIHTGLVVVGNVGSADKMEFTVLGDTVNLASRLESLNKEHHTKLLMSGATQSRLGDQVETALGSGARARQVRADRFVHGGFAGGEGRSQCISCSFLILLLLPLVLANADTKEEPVGLVLSATGSKLLRRGYRDAARRSAGRFAIRGRRSADRKRAGFISVLPRQGDRHAEPIRRSAPGRESAQSEDRARFPSSRRAPARCPRPCAWPPPASNITGSA